MFIEDVIAVLADTSHLTFLSKDRQFIRSIHRRILDGEALTTRQGFALLRLLTQNPNSRFDLQLDAQQFQDLIRNPEWRVPCKPSVWLKNEVRYMGDDVMAFRCTSGREMEHDFSAMKAQYYGGVRLVRVTNPTRLGQIVEFCGQWGFAMDEQTEEYLARALDGRGRVSSAAVWENNIIVDVPDDAVLCQFLCSTLEASPL